MKTAWTYDKRVLLYAANGEEKEHRAKLYNKESVEAKVDECKPVGWILSPVEARGNCENSWWYSPRRLILTTNVDRLLPSGERCPEEKVNKSQIYIIIVSLFSNK